MGKANTKNFRNNITYKGENLLTKEVFSNVAMFELCKVR